MLDPSFWFGRRVLITGHTGFKGSWLLLWLQNLGARVWSLALEPESPPNLFRYIAHAHLTGDAWQHQIGDLSDLEGLKALVLRAQPEVVLHLRQPLVRRGYEILGTWSTNLIDDLHLLECATSASSCAVVMVTTDKFMKIGNGRLDIESLTAWVATTLTVPAKLGQKLQSLVGVLVFADPRFTRTPTYASRLRVRVM